MHPDNNLCWGSPKKGIILCSRVRVFSCCKWKTEENKRREKIRKEKDISLLAVLVHFSYPSLSTLSLRFHTPTSASLRVVSKIAPESYCTGAHWALTLGRGRPEYPKSVLTLCSQLLEKIGFLSLEIVSLFSRIFLWWCKVPYMSDDVLIKILTAWNVENNR